MRARKKSSVVKKKQIDMEEIIAPCGYRCDLCPVYYKNIANIDKQKLSDGYLKYFNSQILPEEIKSCKGCFNEGEKDCLVRSCVFDKRIDNCTQCPDFGCDKLKTKMNIIEDNIKDVSSLSEEDYNLFVRSYASKERLSKIRNNLIDN